ncbi:MAG: hypothetical protein AAF824_17370 [Bacteroidota bacterium]
MADLNADAFLDKNEIHQWNEIYLFYENEQVFTLTDKNHDGHLSFYELAEMLGSESAYLEKQEKGKLKRLSDLHGPTSLQSRTYLTSHPEVLKELFSSYQWLSANKALAESFYQNLKWRNTHQELEMVLHKNLRWLVANPLLARELYTNQQITCKLPTLLTWRTDHIVFMNRYKGDSKLLTTVSQEN